MRVYVRCARGGGGGGGVYGQNNCYYDAAFVIPLNLICNRPSSDKVEF